MESTMSRYTAFFTDGSRQRQFMLAGALVLLLASALTITYFVLRPGYQVLFRDLKPQDAAAIVAELDKQKIPYRIDSHTSAILVPEGDTRAMRLKLMSSDLRLQGAVGFELFNNSDLGLTEFAQKVNYQRALQGELARTIMTLDEIDLARVHLTLPESSIFRREAARPKASVALFMHDGQALAPDTVHGIQRLVAAAVPDLSPADVTILDQKGELAHATGNGTGSGTSLGSSHGTGPEIDDPKFALKQAIEQRYERKILAQIAPIIGASHVSVSVDASLSFDQIRTTRESAVSHPVTQPVSREDRDPGTATLLLPAAKGQTAMPAAGLPPLPSIASTPSTDGTKTDRTLEQVVSEPGSIRRLSVGIVLDHALPQDDVSRLHAVVAASIGLAPARGDVLSIFVRDAAVIPSAAGQSASATPASAGIATPAEAAQLGDVVTTDNSIATASSAGLTDQPRAGPGPAAWPTGRAGVMAFGALLVILVTAGLLGRSVHRMWRRLSTRPARALSQQQRDDYVVRLRALLAQEANPHGHS
jgi:flagellar M-ring protein FliF